MSLLAGVTIHTYEFLDKLTPKMDFLAYFRKKLESKDQKWIRVYDHFSNYCEGSCRIGDLTVPFCEGFREYLLNAKQLRDEEKDLSQNSAAGYWSTFRGCLMIAYHERLLKENLNDFLEPIAAVSGRREFLTLEEVRMLAEATESTMVIFDNELSPGNIRALEEIIGLPVLDRSALILDIFAQRARTKEGRLQVELAQYQYLLPRLSGMGSSLSRQGGGIGTRGPGETKLESDRRHIRERIYRLEEELEQVRQVRSVQRERRMKNSVPVVAIFFVKVLLEIL